ncbi:Meiotic Sister-Chromatid recombination aldehyde dehydrogenase [Monosporozyma unispora]|nr:Meiotic Sister-Chromatid recombination aldehyde dehydrogenase [Kazachstania unispora]
MMVRLNNQYLLNSKDILSGSIVFPFTILLGYLMYKWLVYRCPKGRSVKFITPPIPKQIDSKWVGKQDSISEPGYIEARCPATGRYLDKFRSMNNNDIDNLVHKAELAEIKFNELDEKLLWEKKLTILISLRDFILRHQDLIARIACRDSGKTMIDASMGEILVTLEKLNWCIENGHKVLQPSKRSGPTNLFMKWYKGAEIRYEPLGVISSIVSWNYPFHNLMGPIIASIITGNAIVVKCSEQVVWSSNYFITLVRNCLTACQVDPNLVQLFYCLPPTSQDDPLLIEPANYFTSHEGIKHITFIGSQPIAHHILKCASKSLTPVVVELGGKDAFIVLDSYKDYSAIASIILRGTFQSAGQNCIGIERVIVSAKNYDSLVKLIHERLSKQPLKLGSDIDEEEETINVDMGAMISDNRFNQLESLIKDATSKGARLLAGGSRFKHPKYPNGNYFQPTLLVDVTPDMKIAQNEVFGPILVMMKAESTVDCIKLANSAPFGLGGSVFGKDIKECNYVANKLKTGNVAINDFATFYVCQLPFGGINGSGYGKFGGEEGLLGLCNAKSVCYDKLPFVSTQIPKPLDYPLNNETAWRFVTSFITASYTKSWLERINSIWTLSKESK